MDNEKLQLGSQMDNSVDHYVQMPNTRQQYGNTRVGDVDLGQVIKLLWRQKWLIAATIIIVTGATIVYLSVIAPRYTADVQLLYEIRSSAPVDITAAFEGRLQDDASLLGEIEVLKSRDLVQRVIDRLNLGADPEFSDEAGSDSFFSGIVGNLLTWIDPPLVGLSPEQLEQLKHEWLVTKFLKRLDVQQVGRSRVIDVSFTSRSPLTAATVANVLATLYLTSQLESKFDNAKKTSAWLAEQSQKLREQVEESERAAELYRSEHNLLQTERSTMLVEQISSLNAKLTDASIQRSESEANLAQVRRIAASTVDVSSVAQVLDSNLYQVLREQEIELERREADLGNSLGARHPAIIQLRAEKQKLQQNLAKEVHKIVLRLENDVEVARRREAALAKDVVELKRELTNANRDSVNLRTLERDAEASRLLLDKFMTAFTETTAHQDADSQRPDARIIAQAAIPTKPSFPPKVLLIAVAFLSSFLLGVLLALSRELFDAGYRSASQVEKELDAPVMAHVPTVGAGRHGVGKLLEYLTDQPTSAYAEAVRAICTKLIVMRPDKAPKTLALTSSESGEGKTALATMVAATHAKSGRRVILVDCDIRCSSVGKALNLQPSPGLLEVLSGICVPEAAIRRGVAGGADVLPSGAYTKNGAEQLIPEKLAAILESLQDLYDLIVIDSPPVRGLIDAEVIASIVDVTILVVQWGKTRKNIVRYTATQLSNVGARMPGIVFNKIDIRKLSQYDCGESGYYYGDNNKYFIAP